MFIHQYFSRKKISAFLTFSFIFSTISSPLLAATDPETKNAEPVQECIFKTVANGYLKSFDQIVAPKQEQTLEDLVKNNEKVAIQKPELTEAEKRNLVFTMLAQQSPHKDTVVGPVIDKTFLNKMEVLAGSENAKNSLFNFVNRTETIFGEAALARWLAQPLTDIDQLEKRQAIIQELINNPELFDAVDAHIQKIKKAQHHALVYWKDENKVNEELYKKLYYGSWFNWLNKSSVALEVGTRLDNAAKISTLIELPSILITAGYIGLIEYAVSQKKAQHANGVALTKWQALRKGLSSSFNGALKIFPFLFDPRNHKNARMKDYLDNEIKFRKENLHFDNALGSLENLKRDFEASKGDEAFWKIAADKYNVTPDRIYNLNPYMFDQEFSIHNLRDFFAIIDSFSAHINYRKAPYVPLDQKMPARNDNFALSGKAVIGGALLAAVVFKAYTTKQLANEEILRQSAANHIHEQMIGVATYVDSIKQLHETVKANPAFATIASAPAFATLSGANAQSSAHFNELVSLMDHNTFRGSPSFFSLTGRVLAAHQLMKETKNEMVPAFELAGELDAYLSVAKLYKEFASKRVSYTFAHYVKADAPYMKATAFWNPFVNPNVVVANDFTLSNDAEHPANALITGPNTGGKSTVLKGILLNLMLAQTLTIAPAQDLTFTPYTKINCYLNVNDDTSAGTSLFKAEVLRAKALIGAIRGLTTGQFSFTIMDEMFSGTSPKEGEEAAYMFAKQLAEFSSSMLLIATHFPKLTELEQDTPHFKNYQVTVIKTEDGKLMRPYKLEPGKSFMNVAMDLLKEEGIF